MSARRQRSEAEVVRVRIADGANAVVSVDGGEFAACSSPCPGCPWRQENDGSFPAEAFRLSAPTSYDMAARTFGCHMAGSDSPRICAGFLLSSGAEHNMSVRMSIIRGRFDWTMVSTGGVSLHVSYRAMAIANGVDADDPVLRPCR